MKRWIARTSPLLLALAVVSTSGCNGASSPTEPAFVAEDATVASANLSSISEESRTGALLTKDTSSSDLTGFRRGGDDPAGDDSGRNGGRRGGRNGGRNGGGDDNSRPRPAGTEFEAGVASIAGSTITLTTGKKVTVSATTTWSARGDLTSLAQLQTALNRGQAPRVEGRGTRQANGTIAASTIKAEIDN